ncbi:post-transcriptional regulator [Bacillus kwashiorkori]|uniref:post-transcriptional regulator n=1 Tax=Bacillus kwashiorkori TaxID=1522318 RepID=UPI0007845635|nr:post-transcriptional regulator [Bacillus kwashiorkori]
MDHPYEKYRQEVKAALESKLEEFALLGYGTVTESELWNFFLTKKWRKPNEEVRIYQIVSDIMSLKPSDYMTFATVESLKAPNWFTNEGAEQLKELLK